MIDRTSLTYWFPKIRDAGLPVPKTILIEMNEDERRDVWRIFDRERMTGDADRFVAAVRAAGESLGYPCFLRTSHTSAKHAWERSCFLARPEDVLGHVAEIIEYGELSSIIGMPHTWWAVRELLPTEPIAVCPRFGQMPVCREFRVFVDGDVLKCWHPYWPLEALEQGGAPNPAASYEELSGCSALDINTFQDLARRAGAACGGAWSVDVLATARGWYVTDMAEAEKSFHWEGCVNG